MKRIVFAVIAVLALTGIITTASAEHTKGEEGSSVTRYFIPEVVSESPQTFFMPDSFKNAYTPNDPRFPSQWNTILPEFNWAWNASTGDSNVVLAFIDSGVDTLHEDLQKYRVEGRNFRGGNVYDVSDFKGHGTHVTGIAMADIDNGLGIAGLAGNCSYMPLKINSSDVDQEVAAVNYLADWMEANPGRKVVLNFSIGGTGYWQPEKDAIDRVVANGGFVCGGAGNDGDYVPNLYPCGYDNVMAVGATTSSDSRWHKSNYGENVDIFAPGSDIWTTEWKGGYVSMDGTSDACPHVAGLAALIWSAEPELSNEEVWDRIIETADTITIDKGKVLRINACKALGVEKDTTTSIAEHHEPPPYISSTQLQTGSIQLNYSAPVSTPYALSIYDVTGREVHNQSGRLAGSGQITYNPMSMSEGVYFWRMETEQGDASGKFVWVR